ncbi:aminotransferase A [Priestia taiwanensis]|uniref:Aminotransferase n=1 Tax=Priestia taiwanensis TaxID=1347902 RepID=A0A917EQY6_9BACI|nr:aminotransferase A [Priestia taiwanensis]MBM7363152.1 aminotransferase [Priestia taiwanensis]GGE68119.1 aminotransferase [Priestia taiwanensis]
MKHLINPLVKETQISGIRQFATYVSKFDNVLSLTIGQPDYPTPPSVKESGKSAIDHNKTIYTPNAGLPELCKAACEFVADRYHLTYDPASEVIVTMGASEAIDISFRTILEEGCEVILPAPVYPGYEPIIRLCGATPVYVDTRETNFTLTKEALEAAITEKTRCVVLPYPSNPIGVTLSKETLDDIIDVLKDKDIFVVSDEIYSELVYGEEHQSIATHPVMHEKTIVINGLSKSHSMTGWRIGFAFAPSYLAQEMLKVHQYNVSCATSISQYAAVEALTNARDTPKEMKKSYEERRDFVYKRFLEMGLDVPKPTGAFYLFPSISKFGLSSFDFATKLVEEERVAVIPGSAFSSYGEGHIRISYAYSYDTLVEACDRLERFIKTL